MRPTVLAALAAASLGLAACAAPSAGPVPGRLALPPAATAELATAQVRAFVAVAQRVEPVAEAECEARNPRADCDFLIVVDDRPGMPPNAFQTLGRDGRPLIVFTLALLGEVANEDELAFIMAHEASHHIAGHLARQDQNAALGASVFGQLAAQRAGATPASIRQAQEIGAEVGARSFSKEFELEADALGTLVAAQAGFDPLRGAAFFLRIPDPGDRFLATHPSNAERIATVRRAAAALVPR